MEEQKNGLKKVLGFWDLMGIGVGQIIGSGIMVLTGICIAITGAGTPFAFLLAAVLVICPNLVLAVLGSAVPATGGMYTYVRDYIGKKRASSTWLCWWPDSWCWPCSPSPLPSTPAALSPD